MSSESGSGKLRGHASALRRLAAIAAVPVALLALPGTARADVVTDVNAQMLTIIQATSPSLIDGPPNVARELAMVSGAMSDAINATIGGGNYSFAYTGTASNASSQAAALSAAYTVMNNLYGAGSLYDQYKGVTGAGYYGNSSPYAGTIVGPTTAQYTVVQNALAAVQTQLNALGNGTDVTNGIAAGAAAGNAMISARASDNGQAAMLSTLSYTAPSGSGTTPGIYIPPTSRPALEPTAGTVTPFVISQGQQNSAANSVTGIGSATSWIQTTQYQQEVLRTQCTGGSVALTANAAAACSANGYQAATAQQAKSALYWNDPGGTYQPPGHLMQIADAAAAVQGINLAQHALLDGLVGSAMSDAGAANWSIKFEDNLWRPITAIRDCADNWGSTLYSGPTSACQSNWTSLIATPPHPDYTAGHPGFSSSALGVMQYFFGTDNIGYNVTSQAYCNGGSSIRDSDGNTIGCTVGANTYLVANASTDCNNAAYSVNGTGNDLEAPLLADFSANPNYNGSPLICPITMSFSSFSSAVLGADGSEQSRIYGGIHTETAVADSTAIGQAIADLINHNAIPEPATMAILVGPMAALAMRRRRSRVQGAVVP